MKQWKILTPAENRYREAVITRIEFMLNNIGNEITQEYINTKQLMKEKIIDAKTKCTLECFTCYYGHIKYDRDK